MSTVCNLADLKRFIETANVHETFIYYIGYNLGESVLSRQAGRIAYDASIGLKGYLFQKRLGIGVCEYMIVKASKSGNLPYRMLKYFPTSVRQLSEHDYRAAKSKQEKKDGDQNSERPIERISDIFIEPIDCSVG